GEFVERAGAGTGVRLPGFPTRSIAREAAQALLARMIEDARRVAEAGPRAIQRDAIAMGPGRLAREFELVPEQRLDLLRRRSRARAIAHREGEHADPHHDAEPPHASTYRPVAAREPSSPKPAPNRIPATSSGSVKKRSDPAANANARPSRRYGCSASKPRCSKASATPAPSAPWHAPSTRNGPRTKLAVPPTRRRM